MCQLDHMLLVWVHHVCGTFQVYTKATEVLRAKSASAQEIQDAVNEALAQKTTMFDPSLLVAAGVPVTRVVQQPGELVITFPRGYHAGFSTGTNVGEAANFSLPRWFEHGLDGALRALRTCKTPVCAVNVLSQVTYTLAGPPCKCYHSITAHRGYRLS